MNAAIKTTLGIKNNCFNVKVYFKNICVHVRVRVHLFQLPVYYWHCRLQVKFHPQAQVFLLLFLFL